MHVTVRLCSRLGPALFWKKKKKKKKLGKVSCFFLSSADKIKSFKNNIRWPNSLDPVQVRRWSSSRCDMVAFFF